MQEKAGDTHQAEEPQGLLIPCVVLAPTYGTLSIFICKMYRILLWKGPIILNSVSGVDLVSFSA